MQGLNHTQSQSLLSQIAEQNDLIAAQKAQIEALLGLYTSTVGDALSTRHTASESPEPADFEHELGLDNKVVQEGSCDQVHSFEGQTQSDQTSSTNTLWSSSSPSSPSSTTRKRQRSASISYSDDEKDQLNPWCTCLHLTSNGYESDQETTTLKGTSFNNSYRSSFGSASDSHLQNRSVELKDNHEQQSSESDFEGGRCCIDWNQDHIDNVTQAAASKLLEYGAVYIENILTARECLVLQEMMQPATKRSTAEKIQGNTTQSTINKRAAGYRTLFSAIENVLERVSQSAFPDKNMQVHKDAALLSKPTHDKTKQAWHCDALFSTSVRALFNVGDLCSSTEFLPRSVLGPPFTQDLSRSDYLSDEQLRNPETREKIEAKFKFLLMDQDRFSYASLEHLARPMKSTGLKPGSMIIFLGDQPHRGPAGCFNTLSPSSIQHPQPQKRNLIFMTANPEGVNPESKLQFHALQVALMLYGNSKKRADSMIFPLLKRYEEAKLSPSLESHGPEELKWRYNLWRRIN